jgi:hypothetical protein
MGQLEDVAGGPSRLVCRRDGPHPRRRREDPCNSPGPEDGPTGVARGPSDGEQVTLARICPGTAGRRPRSRRRRRTDGRDRDRRPRDHRRPADRRAGHHRRVDRLVLLPAVRLPQRVRRAARRRARRALPDPPGGRRLHDPSRCTSRTPPCWSPGSSPRRAWARSSTSCRRPGDTATDNHRLVRMVQCVRGPDELRDRRRAPVRLRPAPAPLEVTEQRRGLHGERHALTLHVVREPGDERLARSRRRGDGDVHATLDLVAGEIRGVVLESAADGPPREIRVARSARCSTRRSRSGGRGWPVDLHRPVAGDGPALGDHAEADDLRADRRPGGRAHRGAARAGRRRAQLGLPLHLGARRLVLGARAAAARHGRGGRAVRHLAGRPDPGAGRAATAAR